jgi:predicted dehydrogenase/predicted N-acetyltransferase YhbS
MALEFRSAREADAEAVTRLINQAFQVERNILSGNRIDLDQVETNLQAGEFILAEEEGALAGSVYTELRGSRAYLGLLAVDPARQRGGLGAKLVRAAEALWRDRGARHMDLTVLTARTELPPFYRKLGYAETRMSAFHPLVPVKFPCYLIHMSKPLDESRAAIRVALVGYGLGGRTFHAPVIRGVAGLRLDVVVSSDAAKVHADLPEITVEPHADAVFADPAVDLVVVATPNATHFDLARRALEAGKHVVVDKPFTVTVDEAERLTTLAQRSGRLLSVYQSRRWDPDFQILRIEIGEGALGEVVHFESHYDRFRPTVKPRWKEHSAPGGGIWYDLGPHLVDQALQLFGPPKAIYADLGMQRDRAEAVDYFHVLLRYGKLRVILHASNLVPEPTRRFEVHGTKASYLKCGVEEGDEAGLHYTAFYSQLRDAIHQEAANPVPPEEALPVMRVMEAAMRSSEERREVSWA